MPLAPRVFDFYGKLPVALQNAAISAWGYRTRAIRYGSAFRTYLEWLTDSQWWSAQEIQSYQSESLARVIEHAYRTVPYYKAQFQSLGLRPRDIATPAELTKLPILTKAQLKASDPTAFLSSGFSQKRLRRGLTSGTTGSPLVVWLTPEALQFQWAVWWRHKGRFGLTLGDKYLSFGARLPIPANRATPPFWRRNWAFNQVYLSTYHLTSSALRVVSDWLTNEEFRFYTGYPSAMFVVARYMQEHGIRIPKPPSIVVCGSDALMPAFEREIAHGFDAPVTDQYGSAEACGNFARCEQGKYHLDAEFGFVELLPIEGAPTSRLRRMIFTGLANMAMPLLRYDSGDVALLSEERCSCGRETVTVDRIDGRTEDYVRTPDGRMVMGLNQAFEWASGIAATQVVQNRVEGIRVLVVPGPTFSGVDLEKLEYQLRQRVGAELAIEFEVVDDIPLTKAGKYRAVVSTIPVSSCGESEQRRMIDTGLEV